MIRIEPIAGLANRMRTLDSALAMGRELGAEVRLRWPVDPDLGCAFEELFEPIPGLAEVRNFCPPSISNVYDPKRDFLRRIPAAVAVVKAARSIRRMASNADPRHRYLGLEDVEGMLGNPERILELCRRYDVDIRTYHRFWRGTEDFAGFAPAEPVRKAVSEYAPFCRGAVGVHIRRGDNVIAIANSPIDSFISRMRAMIDDDPSVRFFVATDSPEALEDLRAQFGERITSHPKASLDRGDPRAIKDALIDIYCLASCRLILGSYWSSFTDVASEIGRVPKEIVRS
jgi:hypothetical protein